MVITIIVVIIRVILNSHRNSYNIYSCTSVLQVSWLHPLCISALNTQLLLRAVNILCIIFGWARHEVGCKNVIVWLSLTNNPQLYFAHFRSKIITYTKASLIKDA